MSYLRSFKGLHCTFLLLAVITGAVSASAQGRFVCQPYVGRITDSSATIVIWMDTARTLTGTVTSHNSSGGIVSDTVRYAVDSTVTNSDVVKLELRLQPATHYEYSFATSTSHSALQSFTTFPRIGTDAPMSILFGSCQQRVEGSLGKVFDVAGKLGGDVFLQMGDWVYGDERIPGFPSAPGTIRTAYAMRLDSLYPFAKNVLSQMGFAYEWDDHDYAKNDANGLTLDAATKQAQLEAYDHYMPHYNLPNPAGIWQSFRAGNVEFFMIDDRTQRNPVDSAFPSGTFNPPPGHSMLAGYPIAGVNQRQWLLDAIRKSTARWKILVSQVLFDPAAAQIIPLAQLAGKPDLAKEMADKWVGYPEDVDSMKALFKGGYGKNLLIISGDAHSNAYDNGSHSLVPEFMVANLDVSFANTFSQLKALGINIWTANQPDTFRTVGRIRVETTPVNKLVIESFNENGDKELSYEMIDSSSVGAVPGEIQENLGAVSVIATQDEIDLRVPSASIQECRVVISDVHGNLILDSKFSADAGRWVHIPASRLASGFYFGTVTLDGHPMPFKTFLVQ